DATVPAPDPDAPSRYRRLHQALRSGRVLACHDLSEGGLAVTLAEMAIAGRLGLSVDALPGPDPVSALFSESSGRFVCEIAATDADWLEEQLGEPVTVLGTVTAEPVLNLPEARSLTLAALVTGFGAAS
ncbi:MAG: AIR synthase-related protein, partial [Ilumatobacteraceae bacterium]